MEYVEYKEFEINAFPQFRYDAVAFLTTSYYSIGFPLSKKKEDLALNSKVFPLKQIVWKIE